MKFYVLLFVGTLFSISNSSAFLAVATFSSSEKQSIQVVIDGKVINKTPKSKVKVKGKAGLHEIKIIVFFNDGNCIDQFENTFFAHAGYQSDFKLFLKEENCTELKVLRKSMIYIDHIRRPEVFYNKRYIALIDGIKFESKNNLMFFDNRKRIYHSTSIA